VTGFLGKVVFEKLLRSLPSLNQVFVFIRAKKGSNVMERFKKEVIGSTMFDPLKKLLSLSQFDELISNKVKLIQGDLLHPDLALSTENK
jgi:thioester reductase-like protein